MAWERRLVLGSNSPRRRRLLAEAGYVFEVVPSRADEPGLDREHSDPHQVAQTLAMFKADDVARQVGAGCVVIGADTIVAQGMRIFGKAKDQADAREILWTLSHARHEVITGVAVIDTTLGRRWIGCETTGVIMTPMSDAEIDAYVASGEWIDKAGAYAIQETADRYVQRLEGSCSNVVGLPMECVSRVLGEFGIAAKR